MSGTHDAGYAVHSLKSDKGIDHGPGEALLELGRYLQRVGYRFTTTTPATHERVNRREGNEWASDLAGIFGWSRKFRPALLPPEIVSLMQQADLVQPLADGAMRSRLRASTLGGRLYFHSAFPTTDPQSVFFGPDTYRFASAIEQWLDRAPRHVKRAIDIGCGAGPGALTLALRLPQAQVLATDINRQALRLAATNAALAGAANLQAGFSNLLHDVDGNFDLIVSNPPYLVDPDQRAYRHGGGPLGAQLSLDILAAALGRLSPGGTLLLYTGSAIVQGKDLFRDAAAAMLERAGAKWHYREMDPDVFGEELATEAYCAADRIAAIMLEAVKAPA